MQRSSFFEASSFLAFQRYAILSTHSARYPGYPFGSLVPYDISPDGELIIHIARIAEHYKNLSENPHAAIMVSDLTSLENPQAAARLTVLLELRPVQLGREQEVMTRFERRNPAAINRDIAPGFCFFSGLPAQARWIAGFGQMGWIKGEELRLASVDPLSYNGGTLAAEVQNNHRDKLLALIQQARPSLAAGTLRINFLSSEVLGVRELESSEQFWFQFTPAISSVDEFRSSVLELPGTAVFVSPTA